MAVRTWFVWLKVATKILSISKISSGCGKIYNNREFKPWIPRQQKEGWRLYNRNLSIFSQQSITNEGADAPTSAQTSEPSSKPTDAPTHAPTYAPTDAPTDSPTKSRCRIETRRWLQLVENWFKKNENPINSWYLIFNYTIEASFKARCFWQI